MAKLRNYDLEQDEITTIDFEFKDRLLIKEALQVLKLKFEHEIEKVKNHKAEPGLEFLEEIFFTPEANQAQTELLEKKISEINELISFF